MSRTPTAVLIAAALLTAGCAAEDQTPADAPKDQTPALYAAARTYQEAAARGDWRTACATSSTRAQGGSVDRCVAAYPATAPEPSPTADPVPTVEPPRYADGSTPAPRGTRAAAGPDRADTGPVSATGARPVPAAGEHPAGYAVLVTYSVRWPGKTPTTTRRALRLVPEHGGWRVDQLADLHPGEHSLLTALEGRA
ncbi:hypothetical protein ACPXCP_39955 [Streptomyces sp. DT20]|uniref:hypothetical protein n=1 Tax=Streptomyces sp. DT20 TaxID=3416519 RepID=UPI003CFB0627